jgi:hypothetical protein
MSPPILLLEHRIEWVRAYRQRAMAAGRMRRAIQAANLEMALDARANTIVFASVSSYSE